MPTRGRAVNLSTATLPPTPPVDTIKVELGDRSYPIIIGAGVLDDLGAQVRGLYGPGRVAVVSNPTVCRLYLQRVSASLRAAGCDMVTVEIPDGEEYKTLSSLALIYDQLLAAGFERRSPVIALGGGVVGDVAGFAAATLLRGVPFIQVPTTLLAQVDSSVGGKTGINHSAGKNLIGTFYQPQLVLIDVDTLKTLPRREVLSGLVEVIKYGVILDAALFALLEQQLDLVLALDADLLRQLVRRSCELKAMVVRRDERESDYRAILNFGHTLGHAVESVSGYKRYLHGEAVALGMAFAATLSVGRGYCERETMQRIIALLKRAGLPVDLPAELVGRQLARAVASDKKASSGKIKFVCLESIGQTRFAYLSSEEIVDVAAQWCGARG
jgi:3-dehydroquinate synthase